MPILSQSNENLDPHRIVAPFLEKKRRQSLAKFYMWAIIVLGAIAAGVSLSNLNVADLGLRFILISLVTLAIGSRVYVNIPRVRGQISVSDTFIFFAMLLFGGEAAILLAAADAFVSSLRITKKKTVMAFNAGVYVLSTFLTVAVLRNFFGDIKSLPLGDQSAYVSAICVMAFVSYVVNSGLVATGVALRVDLPILKMWRQNFLWTSITFFAGASAAGVIVKLIETFGLYAFLATGPIVIVVYLTYVTYLKNVEASTKQAQLAERHVEELSRYIAEQERIREQYAQIEKLSALGQLASGVAHNFNNALASILSRSQLMLRRTEDPFIKQNLNLVIQSSFDAATTVRRIRDFARQSDSQDFEPIDVSTLLIDVSEMTRPRWKDSAEAKNIHITLDLQLHAAVLVMGNPSELREVFINIIFNAIDAMPKGGLLRLGSQLVDDSVVISVSDTGEGMSPEVRSRIFDPFFTTKGMIGMGLGLSVSYGIISNHRGTIEVESEVGRGTTFNISLPVSGHVPNWERENKDDGSYLYKPKPVQMTDDNDAIELLKDKNITRDRGEDINSEPALTLKVAHVTPSSIRVLIIDDESLVLTAYRDILKNQGYRVDIASSGVQALEIAKDFCPDIILADNNMPGMTGLQTVQAMRSVVPGALSILTTGYSDIAIATEAVRQSVFDFLLKPISIETLTHSIQRAVLELDARERERRQKDFLSIVSHELRAPLQAPLRFLENILLGDKGELSEKQRDMLQRAAKGIKSEVRLINNLLDLQYLESGRFNISLAPYSLRSVVQEVVDSFQIQAADVNAKISWNPPPNAFVIKMDSEQVKQAVANVLNNAIQHTRPGGAITIKLLGAPNKVRCIIRDEGPGIPLPYLERIFEKSFQVPSTLTKRGLGIGLYIAREIICAHGGDIYVKSALGNGSTFIINVPNQQST